MGEPGPQTPAWHTQEKQPPALPSQPRSRPSASAPTLRRCQLYQHPTPLGWFPPDLERILTNDQYMVSHMLCVNPPPQELPSLTPVGKYLTVPALQATHPRCKHLP